MREKIKRLEPKAGPRTSARESRRREEEKDIERTSLNPFEESPQRGEAQSASNKTPTDVETINHGENRSLQYK